MGLADLLKALGRSAWDVRVLLFEQGTLSIIYIYRPSFQVQRTPCGATL